ncbi:MAG: YidC/Oxa1 family membrane protein insertase [Patescibacteria group bacterium]
MISSVWNFLLYHPLLNILALLVFIIPGNNVGAAIVLLTILVKIILFPLSRRSIEGQAKMNKLAPELRKIKESGKGKDEQARLTLELYKKNKANPFSGCLLLIIQIPIIFALYWVFYKGINFDPALLYSFVPSPGVPHMLFLGINLAARSLALAVLAGASQYLQAHFMPRPAATLEETGSLSDSFAKSMRFQMKYFFPVMVAFIAYSISGAVALYWITSNIISTLQQIYLNKKAEKDTLIT